MRTLQQKLENLPVAIMPTFVGAATLANVYMGMGFTLIRHITMLSALIVLIAYLAKIIMYKETVKKEYSNTVPASLYAGVTMVTMIIGSYIFPYSQTIGKSLWFAGLIVHAIHIIVFTYRNVIKNFNIDTFVPSWFVTFNGIMVSTVIGGVMNEPVIGRFIVYYGIGVLCLIMPFMVYRLIKYPIKDAMYHTQAIILAPSSLCLVSYFNFIKNPNTIIVYGLYIIVLLSLIFVLYKLPKFFKFKFNPGFAGLTFPMAIGIVASSKMAEFLANKGSSLAVLVREISGVQIYVTTAIIAFVLFNFAKMFKKSLQNDETDELVS